jgi:precorrin-6Y C5,15-methyltransferase (decarboxylating)
MTIHVVGLGQDPDNLPEHSQGLIEHAELLCAGRDILEHFEDHPAEKLPVASPLDAVIERLADAHADGRTVVVLADGDPLFYGIGATLVERLGPEILRIYPGVSTLQAAAAKVKIPWQDVAAVSLHGRDDYGPLFAALQSRDWVAVFTDGRSVPSAIAQTILDKCGPLFLMWVLEDLESESERVRRFPLEEAGRTSFSRRNLVLLERVGAPELPLGLGLPDEGYAREGNLITKAPVRAAALAALRLRPGSVVWDLGAGCGAVGIEASALCWRGRVHAVEKNAARVGLIRANVRRTGAFLVEVVHGTAPACLDELPDPDRIFVGGGLLGGTALLEAACARLRPGGRLVANVVLLESLALAESFFAARGWPCETTLVCAAQSGGLAGGTRLEAHNPVFIVAAQHPE